MKINFNIHQQNIIDNGWIEKTDIIDWAIMDYLRDWAGYPHKNIKNKDGKNILFKIIRGNDDYYLLDYTELMNCLPSLKIKSKSSICKRINNLIKLELIKTTKEKRKYILLLLKK